MNAPGSPRHVPKSVRDGPVFTTGEIARICHVTPRTVAKWFDSGQLRGYHVPGGADRRVPRAELIRFLAACDMPPPGWLSERPRLLALSASPLPWLAAALPGWDVDAAGSVFDAGGLFAAHAHAAALIDLAIGRAESLCVARAMLARERPPLLVALVCDDEADAAGLAVAFGLVLDSPDAATLARFLGGAP